MKKVFKSVLLFSVLAVSLLSCSRLFEDDESISTSRNSGGGGSVNKDSLGGKGREVKLDKINKPSIGDVVYYETVSGTDKGRVTTTSNYDFTDPAKVDKILGYVYAIDGDTISVVSKTVHTNQRWASTTGGAVYSGKLPSGDTGDSNRSKKLSEKLSGVPDGYTAWKDRVAVWNPNAIFKYYQAISRALADKKDSKYSSLSGSAQVSSNDVQEIVDGPLDSNGNRPGDSIKDKWYLPNTSELNTIYNNLSYLANDKFYENYPSDYATATPVSLSGKSFWSCEVKETDENNYNVNDEHYAEYVSFDPNNSGTKEGDKNSTVIHVIAVANFKYSKL